jgi:ribosomal protein S18 acetylase RimI-like enzyme
MIRDFRPADGPQMVALLTTQFPAEEAIMGSHPERFYAVVKRVYRPDTRLLLGLMRLVRKPLFRLLVVDEGGRAAATTLLTFPGPAVYLSMVATDPTMRRRGFALSLLVRAQEIARRLGRQYMVLDVLADNAPARALYEGRLDYKPLRQVSFMVHDRPTDFGAESAALPAGVRAFRKSDEAPLLAIARNQVPPEVERVLPRKTTGLRGTGLEERLFEAERATWVVDRGHGPEAGILCIRSPDSDAAHLNSPIVSASADPALVHEMIRAAGAWCARRKALRIATQVPGENVTGHAALAREGFHDALSLWTLYRPVA